ncbi:hypothetical protein [Bacillus phage vB_BanS-Thrax1]|nr:hypothetical protein [Bacillus phage vB_BanS-Thrax1]
MYGEKLTKEEVDVFIEILEKLKDRADIVTGYISKYSNNKTDSLSVDGVYEVSEEETWVSGTDAWGDDCSETFRTLYLYDDEALEKLKEEYEERERLKKEKEEEDKKYYAKLKEEDEIRQLKQLQKKYPNVK